MDARPGVPRADEPTTPDVMEFAETLERVCVDTVEGGKMTKDLALLVGGDQDFLTTEEFLAAIDDNLNSAMASRDLTTSDSTHQEASK